MPSRDDYSRGGTESTQVHYDRVLSDVIRQTLAKAQRLQGFTQMVVAELEERREEAAFATAEASRLRAYVGTFEEARAAVAARAEELLV